MCRLFGFRSVIPSQVHKSLIGAENALIQQSHQHPDGWGVAYYMFGAPHIIKSVSTAVEDDLFKKVSGVVSSQTVLAHLRKASEGGISTVNTHPFQYGNWVFAHNGIIKDFGNQKKKLMDRIPPEFQRFILGETDSEVLFYTLLNHIGNRMNLHEKPNSIEDVSEGVLSALRETMEMIGEFCEIDDTFEEENRNENYLSFVLTNGSMMLAFQGGKKLHYSTYKTRCSDRDICPSLSDSCEAPTVTGFVNHFIVSSEPLEGENVWIELEPGQLVGIDWQMKLLSRSI